MSSNVILIIAGTTVIVSALLAIVLMVDEILHAMGFGGWIV